MPPERAFAFWVAILLAASVVIREMSGSDAAGTVSFVCLLVLTGWRITYQFQRESHRAEHQRSKAASAATELLRVANLTGPDILRNFAGSEPLHRVRVEAVRRFFYQASDIGLTKEEMLRFVGTCDPIVIRDVVNEMSGTRSPWFDPEDKAWRTAVHYYANGHSHLCHRPVDLLAWARSLPVAEEHVSRK